MPVASPENTPPSPRRQGSDPGAPPRDSLTPDEIRRGKRIAAVAFLGLVASWVLAASLQIIQQVLFPEVVPSPYPSCEAGLKQLRRAVDEARHSAAEGDEDPDEALARFRTALQPEWRYLEGIRATCQAPEELAGLDALERLRYAEEHAVRREAASLAALRRRVDLGVSGAGQPAAGREPKEAPKETK